MDGIFWDNRNRSSNQREQAVTLTGPLGQFESPIEVNPHKTLWPLDESLDVTVAVKNDANKSTLPHPSSWRMLSVLINGQEVSTIVMGVHDGKHKGMSEAFTDSSSFLFEEIPVASSFVENSSARKYTLQLPSLLTLFRQKRQRAVPSLRCDGTESNGNYSHCAIRYQLKAALTFVDSELSRSLYSNEVEVQVLAPALPDFVPNRRNATAYKQNCWIVAPFEFRYYGSMDLSVVDFPTVVYINSPRNATIGVAEISVRGLNFSDAIVDHVLIRVEEHVAWKTPGLKSGCVRLVAEERIYNLPPSFQPGAAHSFHPHEKTHDLLKAHFLIPKGTNESFEEGVHMTITHFITVRAVVPTSCYVTNPEIKVSIEIRSPPAGPSDAKTTLVEAAPVATHELALGYQPPTVHHHQQQQQQEQEETSRFPEELYSYSHGTWCPCS